MRTTERRRVEGRACVVVDALSAWTADRDTTPGGGSDLVLVGPRRGRGPRPTVSIKVVPGQAALGDAPERVWESVRQTHPHAVFTSSDLWSHPVWGEGRLVQTARVDPDGTRAHDCYVFVDTDRAVQIELDCALADLLPLEEQVADIVAHVRPKVA